MQVSAILFVYSIEMSIGDTFSLIFWQYSIPILLSSGHQSILSTTTLLTTEYYWYYADCYKVSYLCLSKELSMVSSAKHVSIMSKRDKLAVPDDFFKLIGPTDKEDNSFYEYLKCTGGQHKLLSYYDKSRQNLRIQHIVVRKRHTLTLHTAVHTVVLTVQATTLFVTENIHTTLRLSSFLHHTSELRSGFAECRMQIQNATCMVKVRIRVMGRIRVTVGVIDGIYVVWCEKSIVKKVLVSVQAILFNSSIGIGIGIGNIFHK